MMGLQRDTPATRRFAFGPRKPLKRSPFQKSFKQTARPTPTPQQLRRRAFEAEHSAMRRIVLARDRYCRVHVRRCTNRATEAHHVLPRSRGGPNELWNYLGLCHDCHQYVHHHPRESEANGWLASIGACCELEARAA
jgi:hypothetical protein